MRFENIFQREKLTASVESAHQSGLLGVRDWNLFASHYFTHREPSFAFLGPKKTDAFNLTGGINKLFWNTGGRLSASFSTVEP